MESSRMVIGFSILLPFILVAATYQAPGKLDNCIATASVSGQQSEKSNTPADVDDSEIPWQTVNAGGGDASATSNEVSCSVWQPAIGRATSANLRMGFGFWYGVCNCSMLWGDLNCDVVLNPVDVVYMVNYVYRGIDIRCYPPGWNCPFDLGDVNCDGNVNPVDVVYYVNYVYLGNNLICDNPCSP